MRYLIAALTITSLTSGLADSQVETSYHRVLAPKPHKLEYVESSTGLDDPQWDGGRTELEMVDVDDDGNIDIISIGDHGSPYINTNEHGIMVYFGNGAGSWDVFMNGNFGYGGIALGDVNNDGYIDAGYAMHHNYSSTDFGDQLIEVALGDGTGENWTPWDDGLATNGETYGMFCTDFADVDNDGDLDLVAVSFGAGSGVHVYLNQGDGTWVQSFGFLGGNSTMDVVFGDVNSDGNADFAVAHEYGTVYIGDGSGGFSLADGNLPSPGSMGRRGPDLGDVNNDGYQDLSFANSNGGVEVWTWQGSNTWSSSSTGLPAAGDYLISQLCDMNSDGTVDLVGAGEGFVTVWKNNGSGVWTEATEFDLPGNGGYTEGFRTGGDADHNGYADMVILNEEGNWPNDKNHLRFYREASTPSVLSIRVTSPNGYETFKAGSVRFIEWVSGVPAGGGSTVNLELSFEGPSGPWVIIAADLPNNCRLQGTVPAGRTSSDCYLRATVYSEGESGEFVTTRPFSIIE